MSSDAREGGKSVHLGCVSQASLLSAAAAVSVGISHAIQHIRDLNQPVQPRSAEEVAEENINMNKGSPMESMASFKKKLDSVFEEKKEDPFCGYTYDCTKIGKSDDIREKLIKEPTTYYSTSFSSAGREALSEGKRDSLSLVENARIQPTGISASDQHSSKPVESASPMARMRDESSKGIDQDLTVNASALVRKTQEEIKAEQQQRWKTKMKIAQERKKKERIALDGSSRRRRKSTVNGRKIANMIGNQVLELIEHQCGAEEDVFSDSEDSMYDGSLDEDTSASSHGDRGGRAKRLERKRQQQQTKDVQGNNSQDSSSPRMSPGGSEKADNSGWSGEKEPGQNKTGPKKAFEDPTSPTSTRLAGNIGVSVDPMRSPARQNAAFVMGQNEPLDIPHLTPSRSAPISELSNVSSRASEKMNPKDRGFVQAFVYDMVHIGFSFFWQKETMTMNPTTVTLRLKKGYRTPQGTYCGPRLVWQESEFETYGVNLFDIQLLERASPVQLKDYPYAIPSRTVYLLLNRGQEFVFEAPSENDAYRFIHGMRWLVARLTFNMIIGNADVVAEILDIRASTSVGKFGENALFDDSRRGIAMDDMAEQLVERSVISFPDDKSEDSI